MIFDDNPPGPVPLGVVPFPSVRAAASVNVSLTVPPVIVDGVALGPTVDRLLLTAQTAPAENGLYVLTGSGAETGYNLGSAETGTHTATAGRLFRVTVTGGVVVHGANGTVAGPNAGGGFGGNYPTVGFLDPGEDGVFNFHSSVGYGGTATFLANTTLVRIDEANQAAEFVAGRPVLVEEGVQNGGTWWNRTLPTTLGTDPLNFAHKVASGIALDQFPAGIANPPDGIAWTPPT